MFEYPVDLKTKPGFIRLDLPAIFHPELQGIGEGPKPDIQGKTKFLIKLQAGDESLDSSVNLKSESKVVKLYDQSLTVGGNILSEELFTFVRQCGVLGCTKYYCKKLYCWAKVRERNFQKVTIYLDRVAEPPRW